MHRVLSTNDEELRLVQAFRSRRPDRSRPREASDRFSLSLSIRFSLRYHLSAVDRLPLKIKNGLGFLESMKSRSAEQIASIVLLRVDAVALETLDQAAVGMNSV